MDSCGNRDQEALTSWMIEWSTQCTFPIVTPIVGDDKARELIKAMLPVQQG